MVTMAELNARMDKGLERRAWLHRLRKKGRVDVQNYKGGLKAVRDLEDEIEPQRKALGAKHSRAFERVTVLSDGYYLQPEGEAAMSEQHDDLDLSGAPPEPKGDPFAEVPAEPGEEAAPPEPAEGTLGGDGATLADLEQEQAAEPQPGEFLEDPEAAEPEPEPVETIENSADAQEEATPEPEPEPEPEAPKDQPVSEDRHAEPPKKSGSSTRHYAILMKDEQTGQWSEPFADIGGIEAANGEIALREAYNKLVPQEEEKQIELVCFPTHYWKPRKVGAKAKIRRSVTIE